MAFTIPGITGPSRTEAQLLDPAKLAAGDDNAPVGRISPQSGDSTAQRVNPPPAPNIAPVNTTSNVVSHATASQLTAGASNHEPGMKPDSVQRAEPTSPSDYRAAVAHFAGTAAMSTAENALTRTAASSTTVASTPPKAAHTVGEMSLADKVVLTTRAGMVSAAKDATGTLKTALSDPKTDAGLAAFTGAVVGAQFVPGVDVAVDVGLGTAGVAMYGASVPEHRDNMLKAAGKLRDYVREVGSAKTQADLDRASKDFADFVKLGGSEALDAAGTFAGGAAATVKLSGAAKVSGAIDAAKTIASDVGSKVSSVAHSATDAVVAGGDAIAQHLVSGLGYEPDLAVVGPTRTEMRSLPVAVRGSRTSGSGNIERAPNATIPVRAGEVLTGSNPNTLTGLHPNATYEFEGGFAYHTDALGRVHQVEATLASGVKAGGRNQTIQRTAGGIDRLTTDEGGHLIAVRFNGPAHEANHIAQDIKLNRGDFKTLENEWASELNAGKTLNVKIDLRYPIDSQRPKSLKISYTSDGADQKTRTLKNEAPLP